MFKFLVYLFLFYVVSKFIFGTLLNFKQHSTPPNFNDEKDDDKEVKIKTNPKSSTKYSTKTNHSDIGEYVDFEEIK